MDPVDPDSDPEHCFNVLDISGQIPDIEWYRYYRRRRYSNSELFVSFTLCQWAETLAGKLDPSRTASIIKDLKNVNVSDPDVY